MERLDAEVAASSAVRAVEGDTAAIARSWPAAVGETVAERVAGADRPGGTLHVNTSSSTWAFELGRLAETILAQLRAELGEAAPQALVRSADRPSPAPGRSAGAGQPRADRRRACGGRRIAAAIEDDELRRLVARAAAASLAKGARHPLTTGVSDTLLPPAKRLFAGLF